MSLPKVEDAFEVWEASYRRETPGGASAFKCDTMDLPPALGGPQSIAFRIMKAAFLAGVEYGAAVGEPWQMSTDELDAIRQKIREMPSTWDDARPEVIVWLNWARTVIPRLIESKSVSWTPCPKCGAPLTLEGDDFEACGLCASSWASPSARPKPKCGAGHKDGVTCRRPRGHEGDHVFPGDDVLRGVCGALGGEPLRGCDYQYCHEGKHSWETVTASLPEDTIWKLDTSKLKAKIWDNTPQSNPDMTHSTASFTPLVPVPKDFWVTMRCRDLAQAIKEWLEYDSGKVKQRDANESESPDIIGEWIDELEDLWETL